MKPALAGENVAQVHPDVNWPSLIQTAAQEVFQLMVGPKTSLPAKLPQIAARNVSAMVGMAGALSAVCKVRCSETCALSIARKMLGEVDSRDLAVACDAVGEICNMVAGNLKAKIPTLVDRCFLSIPTVVTGDDYDVRSTSCREHIDVSLEYEGQPILVSLEIHA
jgi:chemotaxis protein CheX